MRFLAVLLLLRCSGASWPWEAFGSLRSPNFPEPYPPDLELRWNLSVPRGFRLQLYFSHFHLEPSYLCQYDFLKVEAEGEVLGLFCGQEDTDTEAVPAQKVITSPRNALSLVFSSDFSDEERFSGFQAHYSAVDVDECKDQPDEDLLCDHFCHNYIGGYYCSCRYGYLLHSDNRTCRVECSDMVFRERTGVLSSVDFPAPYPKSSECRFRLEVEEGFRLQLHFDHTFDVEDHPDVQCPYDYVQVAAGNRQFGPFCGNRSPGLIDTDSNQVTVLFHSDNSGENLGWRLTYTAIGSRCLAPERPAGILLSPDQSEYSFRDHVVFSCLPGFRLLKNGELLPHLQLECQADGSWSGAPPRCHTVDCGNPRAVDMADVVFGSHDNRTTFGATVSYVCRDQAFSLQPDNSSYTCGPGGQWVHPVRGPDPPACLPACGLPSRPLPSQVKRVVGGRPAPPGLFPWQVLLSVRDRSRVPEDRWFGSGALLDPHWVLTAAHVLRSLRRDTTVVPLDPGHVQVSVGEVDFRSQDGGGSLSVEQIFLHPDFRPDNYNNDIALLRLSRGAELSGAVRPVCLPPPRRQGDAPSPPPLLVGLVAGWGVSRPGGPTPAPPGPGAREPLQYAKLPVVPQDECAASYASRSGAYNVTADMFCAGFPEGGPDACLGDSGGAFVAERRGRWAALGLVSWGGPEDCGSRRVYGVYTRVAHYVDWIHNLTGIPYMDDPDP